MDEIVYPKYRWVVIATLCLIQAVAVAVLVAPAPLIGPVAQTVGLSLGETTGLVMVVVNIFVVLSSLVGGSLIDCIGPYRIWAGGALLFIIGLLLVPVCGGSVWGLFAIRALHGIGAGPVMATAPLVVAQWAPPRQRGVLIGVQGACVSIGAAFSMIVVPAVFQWTGSWRIALAGMSVLASVALAAALVVLWGPEPPMMPEACAAASSPNAGKGLGTIRPAATWAAVSCGFWFAWVVRITYDMIPNYLAMGAPVGVGLGPVRAGRIMSGVHILSMAGAVASGILMEKLFRGHPRGLVMIGFLFKRFRSKAGKLTGGNEYRRSALGARSGAVLGFPNDADQFQIDVAKGCRRHVHVPKDIARHFQRPPEMCVFATDVVLRRRGW